MKGYLFPSVLVVGVLAVQPSQAERISLKDSQGITRLELGPCESRSVGEGDGFGMRVLGRDGKLRCFVGVDALDNPVAVLNSGAGDDSIVIRANEDGSYVLLAGGSGKGVVLQVSATRDRGAIEIADPAEGPGTAGPRLSLGINPEGAAVVVSNTAATEYQSIEAKAR
jgi:hypothetical protein